MTKFSEVANLYLGCEMITEKGNKFILSPNHFPSNWNDPNIRLFVKSKPILRRLSSMTEEEKRELQTLMQPSIKGINLLPVVQFSEVLNAFFNKENPKIVLWLLSKHFDLFGLLDNNEAIESPSLSIGGEEKTK